MKKIFMILFLSLSIALTFACSKDDGDPIYKEESSLPLEKEEEPTLPVEEEAEKIVYKDDLYGFSLELPSSWEGKYTVERETWIDDVSDSVSFNFKEDNIFNNIFTIVIMNESFSQDEWEELFLIYIVEDDGKTFSYLNIMEPTEELLQEENKDVLERLTDMVESVPEVIESFNIER